MGRLIRTREPPRDGGDLSTQAASDEYGGPFGGLPTSQPKRLRSRTMAATILIVEDEYAVARGIQYALEQEGYDVTVARKGSEGLDFATRQAPDLVILDVRLPDMDGFEVLRRLRG